MTGMILAAGRGTRLAPLTDTLPKALVDIDGRPILQHVADRLVAAGTTRIVVNVHYLADLVVSELAEHPIDEVETIVSDEREELLDTGGGLLKASAELATSDGPVLLHNVDILSDIDLGGLRQAAIDADALAALAVMPRDSARALLFDDEGLYGRVDDNKGVRTIAREPVGETTRLGFCGIHAISPRIFSSITETGSFPIVPLYLRLVAAGERVVPFRVDGADWIDIGTPERLARAREYVVGSS